MKKGSDQGAEIAAVMASMGELVAEAAAILRKTTGAFRRSRLDEIRDISPGTLRASITGSGLINSVLELVRTDDGAKKALIGAISHLERICVSSAEMAAQVRSKIERDILLSIHAYGECNDLFSRSIGIVDALGRLLGGEGGHAEVEGLCCEMERLVYESGRRHEERLIKGVCAVKASDLFIGMLDLFRAIAFHSSQATVSLGQVRAA